ncbi:unnamed protein product, partial [Rotaria magnacalcarata]
NTCLQGNPQCLNGGACISAGNTYVCSCPAGYTGVNCGTANFANTCLQGNPQCLNGGA